MQNNNSPQARPSPQSGFSSPQARPSPQAQAVSSPISPTVIGVGIVVLVLVIVGIYMLYSYTPETAYNCDSDTNSCSQGEKRVGSYATLGECEAACAPPEPPPDETPPPPTPPTPPPVQKPPQNEPVYDPVIRSIKTFF